MITITARCQTCTWRWMPAKADGPALDAVRARKAAESHARANPGHTTESKSEESRRVGTRGIMRSLSVEIVRR